MASGAAVLLAGIALATVFMPGFLTSESLDPETLCPEEGISRHTLIVIDRTDSLTNSQARAVKTVVEKVKTELVTREKLSLYEVDPVEMHGLSRPWFSVCKPREKSSANPLYENPEFIDRRFKERFGQPLEDLLREKLGTGGASESPIMQTLMDIAVLADFDAGVEHRRLILISDMLQHDQYRSHYTQEPDFKAFMSIPSGNNMVPDLSGIDVEVHYLLRSPDKGGNRQTNRHVAFWAHYFDAAGSPLDGVQKIR